MIGVDRKYGITTAFCDTCTESEEVDGTNLLAVITVIKEKGWRIRKLSQGWSHTCKICLEAELNEAGLTYE